MLNHSPTLGVSDSLIAKKPPISCVRPPQILLLVVDGASYWSGRIQISLVSFGVQFYVATEAKSQISFNQISRSTGERVRDQKVHAEAENQSVTSVLLSQVS